jgi:GNAT superfamily N-acetyltransferase
MIGDALTLSIDKDESGDVASRILALLEESNSDRGHPRGGQHFCATLRGAEGPIHGGISAQSFWGWLYIVSIAIEPSWRGLGYGRRLLATAEAWGSECGCRHAWLMTMTFQARAFYERNGYVVFGELDNFPGDERRLFMRKQLVGG